MPIISIVPIETDQTTEGSFFTIRFYKSKKNIYSIIFDGSHVSAILIKLAPGDYKIVTENHDSGKKEIIFKKERSAKSLRVEI